MGLIAEIIVELILAGGIWLFGWCIKHKNATLAILAVVLVIVDVIVLLKVVR